MRTFLICKVLVIFVFFIIFSLESVFAAHFIIGKVNDSEFGEPADGHLVIAWNPSIGMQDNVSDIVGVSGNSGTSQYYMIDCEMLSTPCQIGDTISIKVENTGDYYLTSNVSVVVSGEGYDIAPELKLNEIPVIYGIEVDDSINSPLNEIDLIAGGIQTVHCTGIASDFEDSDSSLNNASGVFYSFSSGIYGEDDLNEHYTNSSCSLDNSYGGANESLINCTFYVQYFARNEEWNCTLFVKDSLNTQNTGSNSTYVNSLLAISMVDSMDYGVVSLNRVTNENILNITNFGNVILNISIRGYAKAEGDNLSMNCSNGTIESNISVGYHKYNLTSSNPGNLDLTQFESLYYNLSSEAVVRKFGLKYRENDTQNEATNNTYWRIYVPAGIEGSCTGNIVFGATRNAES